MVFYGETQTTDSTADSATTTAELGVVEAADRVATVIAPFLDFLSLIVQTLTVYTLIKKI